MNRLEKLRKGPTMIELAPVAKFTSMWQVIAFWIFQFWFLGQIGDLFHVPVLELMFGWIPVIGRFFS